VPWQMEGRRQDITTFMKKNQKLLQIKQTDQLNLKYSSNYKRNTFVSK
jgi:hypothetical protein